MQTGAEMVGETPVVHPAYRATDPRQKRLDPPREMNWSHRHKVDMNLYKSPEGYLSIPVRAEMKNKMILVDPVLSKKESVHTAHVCSCAFCRAWLHGSCLGCMVNFRDNLNANDEG